MIDTLPIAFAVFLSILYHIQPVPADVGPGGWISSSLIVPPAGVFMEASR